MPPLPSYHWGPMSASVDGYIPHTEGMPPRPRYHVAGSTTQRLHEEVNRFEMCIKGSGFLYKRDGATYYSPNCRRPDLKIPLKPDSPNDGTIRNQTFNLAYFEDPQWWSKAHGFLAFLPLSPDCSQPPLRPLMSLPPVVYDEARGPIPDARIWEEWKGLQLKFSHAIDVLLHETKGAAVRTALPCSRVDSTSYKGPLGRARLRSDLKSAQDWFLVWFGCLSYAIAVCEAAAREGARSANPKFIPHWMLILLEEWDRAQEEAEVNARQAAKDAWLEIKASELNLPTYPLPPEPPVEVLLDEIFVSDLANSWVAQFGEHVERVGAFLTIPDGDTDEMPSIDWLVEFGIPVWYAWGDRERAIARKNPFWERFAPPSDAEVVPLPSKPWSGPEPEDDHHSEEIFAEFPADNDPAENDLALKKRPDISSSKAVWVEFFHRRTLLVERLEKQETADDKARRLDRKVHPPTDPGSTRFYEWRECSTEGGFIRHHLSSTEEVNRLFGPQGKYGSSQARYDPFFNEWDLCEYFGIPDPGQIDLLAEEQSEMKATPLEYERVRLRVWYGLLPTKPYFMSTLHSELAAATERESGQLNGTAFADFGAEAHGGSRAEEGGELEEGEVEDAAPHDKLSAVGHAATPSCIKPWPYVSAIADEYFGFSIPIVEGSKEFQSGEKGAYVPKILGVDRQYPSAHDFWKTKQGKTLFSFVQGFLAKGGPDATLWDLSPDNRMPIQTRPRYKYLRSGFSSADMEVATWNVQEGYTFAISPVPVAAFHFALPPANGWTLGATSASVALCICRLSGDMQDAASLAYYLYGKGIKFNTWMQLPSKPAVRLRERPQLLSLRSSNYVYGEADYARYQLNKTLFLNGRAGRAALLHGGIIWRLAVEDMGFIEVLAGPSASAAAGCGLVCESGTGGVLVDDSLTETERDFICGAYISVTGRNTGEELGRKYWWPPSDLWEARFGAQGWTSDAEKWFHTRLMEIHESWTPLTRNRWRDLLKVSSAVSKIHKSVEAFSKKAIQGVSLRG